MVKPEDVVSNVEMIGLDKSIAASKYPFALDVSKCNSEITKTVTRLATAPKGSGEDTFLHGIVVQFDLTFPIKVWVQAERYHFLEFVSSQSTMHCGAKFKIREQCTEYVCPDIFPIIERLVDEYNESPSWERELTLLDSLPVGFLLTARMTTNYQQFKTIYSQRKMHKHPYWRAFCAWLETLPHSEFITGKLDEP